MIKIRDLVGGDQHWQAHASVPEANPLMEQDALQEAQLLEVSFDALSRTVGIIFELRLALQLREANTGVLVARGVRELRWSGPSRGTNLTAWSVDSSRTSTEARLFHLSLVMWPHPGAELLIVAESAAFVVGDVPGLPPSPLTTPTPTGRPWLAG